MRQLGAGPHKVNDVLAGYLRAERDLGRVRAEADVDTAARQAPGSGLICRTAFRPSRVMAVVVLHPILFGMDVTDSAMGSGLPMECL